MAISTPADPTALPSRPTHSTAIEPALQPFLAPSFDPVDFLNDALPPLTLASSQPHASRLPRSVPLSELSSQTQAFLSQLNAQNARLSNTLTQFTDEILRSGGRLAYEVEILRGETVGLSDALSDVLQEDIQKLVITTPEALPDAKQDAQDNGQLDRRKEISDKSTADNEIPVTQGEQDPDFIAQLRMLSQVRSRLEDVIHTFGQAMEWPLPPSEVSLTSSLISVSAPDPGPESHSCEEKGREVAKKLRNEVLELLESHGGGVAGVEAASERVESLRTLASVWKGTAEEKARFKFVEGLAKIVENKRKALEAHHDDSRRRSMESSPGRSAYKKGRPSMDQIREEKPGGEGRGIFRGLQRLRDEIYLD